MYCKNKKFLLKKYLPIVPDPVLENLKASGIKMSFRNGLIQQHHPHLNNSSTTYFSIDTQTLHRMVVHFH